MKKKKKKKVAAKPQDLIEIKFWVFMRDNGDGSSSAIFCSTKKKADKLAEEELEEGYATLCDNVYEDSIVYNPSTGLIEDNE